MVESVEHELSVETRWFGEAGYFYFISYFVGEWRLNNIAENHENESFYFWCVYL